MTNEQLKSAALLQIRGKLGTLFGMTFVIELIVGLSAVIPLLGALVVTPAFSLGLVFVYLGIARNAVRKPQVKEVFAGFEFVWSAFKATFLPMLSVFLWSLLLIVPGLIKAVAYSQTMYLVAENPEMSVREAMRRSSEMMEGHKMDYVMLQLSFLGWILLSVLTLGILMIWVIPYMNATNTNFYLSLKREKESAASASSTEGPSFRFPF